MDDSHLYFIAFVPPQEIAANITGLKVNFSKQYHCIKALKLFPHITLQKPFKRSPVDEAELHLNIQPLVESFRSFEVSLNGFGCFDKKNNKVIYIRVEENNSLAQLHRELMLLLRSALHFSENETDLVYHPHITVAYRDLSAEDFHKAWAIYKGKPFSAKFNVNKILLLKHNFRNWEVLSEFTLRK